MKTIKTYIAIAAFSMTLSGMLAQNVFEEGVSSTSNYNELRATQLANKTINNKEDATTNQAQQSRMAASESINYQAVARDAGGNLIVSTPITVAFDIHEAAAGGTVVFSETQNPTTDSNGVFSVQIGSVSGLSINWASNAYFLEVSLNGTSVGTTEFVSVPYAKSADSMPLEASIGESLIDADGLTVTADNNVNYGEVMDIRATAPVTSSNDILNLDMPVGSSENAQFIEARFGGTAVFQVQGDGRVLVNATTTAPQLNTVYGNSLPIAYASVSAGGVISTGYGVTSVTNSATGVYDVVLDLPTNPDNTVVSISPFTTSIGVPEICGYNPTGINTFTVFIQTTAGAGRSSAFSFVVYGN